jgi:hypothetical protein
MQLSALCATMMMEPFRKLVQLSLGQPLAVLRVLVALADFPAHIIKHNANSRIPCIAGR